MAQAGALARHRPVAALYGADGSTGRNRGTVHEPDRVLAGRAVAPQDVGLAVSVKVRDSCDAPVEIRRRSDGHVARNRGSVHEIDRALAGRAVAPQDVRLAVPIEIAYHANRAVALRDRNGDV